MRKLLVPVAMLLVVAVVAGLAVGGNGNGNNKTFEYAIGLWGDLPYTDTQAKIGVPNLIADMNNADLQFTVHDGDLKAGNGVSGSTTPTLCVDPLYVQGLAYLNSLEKPAMFTPGDNDWTDCDRNSNAPAGEHFNSLERLQHERSVFFSTANSLGQKTMKLEVQSTPECLGATINPVDKTISTFSTPCVENRRWEVHDVMYVTVNVQGTCNNLCSSGAGDLPSATDVDPVTPGIQFDPARLAEYTPRNAADIAWLQDSFAKAKANGDAGIMIIGQADPGFDRTGSPYSPPFGSSSAPDAPTRDPATLDFEGTINAAKGPGFKDFLTTLRNQSISFGKPVVYVHGDTHYFRIDKPLLDKDGKRLENFTRVETFGDNAANELNDVHWVKALVDPQSRDVFAFQPQTVPGNVVTHTP